MNAIGSERIKNETATSRKIGKLYLAYRQRQRTGLKVASLETSGPMEEWRSSANFTD
jgi:hypothetical protein